MLNFFYNRIETPSISYICCHVKLQKENSHRLYHFRRPHSISYENYQSNEQSLLELGKNHRKGEGYQLYIDPVTQLEPYQ